MLTQFSNIARSEGDPRVLQSGQSSMSSSDRLGRMLGWFSIGLGMAEIMAPSRITRMLGMEGKESLIRAYGAREIASGIVSLSVDKNVGLWSRVAGDGLDAMTLVGAMQPTNRKRGNVALALAMILGVTAVDLMTAKTTTVRHARNRGERRSYADRSGFPKGLAQSQGMARDFQAPADMRVLPYARAHGNGAGSGRVH